MKQVLNGSEIVLECLKEQGVDTVFGYPGGAILNIYDELYKQSDKIHHVLTSHEQGASHAADGYARATGKVGVCMATSGPGATNLVTGLATAYMDSIPVVAITANVGVSLLGKDSFQEIDIKGVTMPVTKHNYIVKDIEKLADTIREAFQIAQSGRKGPVLVDITKDVTAAKTYFESMEPAVIHPVCETIKEKSVKEAIEMIEAAKQPYVLLGGGCTLSDASEQVREFVKKIDAPVCDTLMGKGVFPGEDPAYTGMLGMHGTKPSNIEVSQSDLLIAIGTRFSDRVYGNAKTFASRAKIIQIDIDPAEVNKNILIDTAIIGDVKAVLTILNRRLSQQHHEAWMQEIQDMKAKYPLNYDHTQLTGPYIIEKLYELTNEQGFLEDARRIEEWTRENLLDGSDDLFWDAKMVDDGAVNTQKWSYNAGFMIRGWLYLYKATGEESYLRQAKATLASAEARWFNPVNGSLNDPGYFAFALVDAWFDLYDLEKDPSVLSKALQAIGFIHESLRDANGRYPEYWNAPLTQPLAEYDLRMQSCVAYLYMLSAGYIRN